MAQTPKKYRQKVSEVTAVQFIEADGPGEGIIERPKKHPANPTDFYIVNRAGKEIRLKEGDFVLTYPDGANEVVEEAAFGDLYDEIRSSKPKPKPKGKGKGKK